MGSPVPPAGADDGKAPNIAFDPPPGSPLRFSPSALEHHRQARRRTGGRVHDDVPRHNRRRPSGNGSHRNTDPSARRGLEISRRLGDRAGDLRRRADPRPESGRSLRSLSDHPRHAGGDRRLELGLRGRVPRSRPAGGCRAGGDRRLPDSRGTRAPASPMAWARGLSLPIQAGLFLAARMPMQLGGPKGIARGLLAGAIATRPTVSSRRVTPGTAAWRR